MQISWQMHGAERGADQHGSDVLGVLLGVLGIELDVEQDLAQGLVDLMSVPVELELQVLVGRYGLRGDQVRDLGDQVAAGLQGLKLEQLQGLGVARCAGRFVVLRIETRPCRVSPPAGDCR